MTTPLVTTVHAVASPPGASERAVLRVSGPSAHAAAALVFAPALPRVRAQVDGELQFGAQRVPAFALSMPAPHSYTGEDVVELHVPGSPLLLAAVQRVWAAAPAALALQPAAPGEFTRRAFANGRIDLAQAEGVLLLIHGEDRAQQRLGLQWLQGGLSAAVAAARSDLQDALAMVEAGLDFTDGETGAVDDESWRAPLRRAHARLHELARELPAAAIGGEVLLLGAANAGKSSLCNALAGRDVVLVDAVAGTTRDLVRVPIGGDAVLWDAPGDLDAPGAWDRAALLLRDRLGARAAAALLVVDPAAPHWPHCELPVLAIVWTKADRAAAGARPIVPPPFAGLPQFAVRAHAGTGLEPLRAFLRQRAQVSVRGAGAPQRAALAAAAAAAATALAAPAGLGGELVGLDLQAALRSLDEVDGRHAPDDLLDRIFGRFCLGK